MRRASSRFVNFLLALQVDGPRKDRVRPKRAKIEIVKIHSATYLRIDKNKKTKLM